MEAYEYIEKQKIEEINGEGTLYYHKKSGAKVITISNDDENKTFLASFHTPDSNSKGIPHIIEHSVLCGSEKYPLKDPFVTLMKGSINSFLNAMTYPDKTVYPVSSVNDKDFKKLMDVYLDAVLHPLLLKKKEIFLQEGWRCTKDEQTGKYGYNGVVYSEMSGNMSSPDFWLEIAVLKALYPDVGYAHVSGGIPDAIVDLSYEELLAFYKKHYHPSNGVFYIYGNMDMEEYLDFLDKEYLCKFDKIALNNESLVQSDFSAPSRISAEYPKTSGSESENTAYLAYGVRISQTHDLVSSIIADILNEILVSAPSAILKKALLNEGIGENFSSNLFYEFRQPSFCIFAQNANPDREKDFERIIRETLENTANKGIDKKLLSAAITKAEFAYREEDFKPKGLYYAILLLDRMNYSEERPFDMLRWKSAFAEIKQKAETGLFEEKIREWFLDNKNCAYVVMKESETMLADYTEALNKKCEKRSSAFTDEDKALIEKETKLLDDYRLSEDDEDTVKIIPVLEKKDLTYKKDYIETVEISGEKNKSLFQQAKTNGICYVDLFFDLRVLSEELLPYAALLKDLIGKLPTAKHTEYELTEISGLYCGNIFQCAAVFPKKNTLDDVYPAFKAHCSFLTENAQNACDLLTECLLETVWSSEKRIGEVIAETRSYLINELIDNAFVSVSNNVKCSFAIGAKYDEILKGRGYFKFLTELCENYDSRAKEIAQKLEQTAKILFSRENMKTAFIGESKETETISKIFDTMLEKFTPEKAEFSGYIPSLNNGIGKTAGLTLPAQIQYVSVGGVLPKEVVKNHEGVLQVVKHILSSGYLWQKIRVEGGAYGCFVSIEASGYFEVISYRDPQLEQTIEVFKSIPEMLKSFDPTETQMKQYIVGALNKLEQPLSEKETGEKMLYRHFVGISKEEIVAVRQEVIETTPANIREAGSWLEEAFKNVAWCVGGGEEALNSRKELFDSINSML